MAQINKPDEYFNTKLYTGNGSSQSITGVGFQPDLLWIKSRGDIGNHFLSDVIRGSTKRLKSNATDAEDTITSLSSFDSDGFTLSNTGYNGSGETFATWNWLAGGTASSNTDGSITSSVSANTTSGFSIVSYTGNGTAGATIGHGLGVAPSLIITKARTNAGRFWGVYSKSLGNTGVMALNSTQAFDTSTTYWNDTTPSSSVFTVGTNGDTNSASGMIAYCFAEKQGYSKFGSYVGNGSTDGTFVYTGFKPAIVIVKSSSIVESWYTYDNKRTTSGGNPEDKYLLPNQNIAEGTFAIYDFLSNGFKLRDVNPGFNNSGVSYIYMAFAENPLVGTNNIPATAR
jgi:hypothetical protein